MIDQRLEEASDAVRAALADAQPPAAGISVRLEPRGRRPFGPALAAAGAFVLVLLVVGMASLLWRSAVSEEARSDPAEQPITASVTSTVRTTAASTTAPPVATTQPAPAAEPYDVTSTDQWDQLADESGMFGTAMQVSLIVRSDAGFVAAGGGSAWWSSDGISWNTAEIEDGGRDTWIWDAVAVETGFVAVGTVSLDGFMRPGIWVSEQGQRWDRTDVAGEFGEESFDVRQLRTIAATGSGYFVAGGSCPEPGDTCPFVPTVWSSPDGVVWERSVIDDAWGVIADLIVARDRVVAFGSVADERGTEDVGIWVLDDGQGWQRVAQTLHDELVFGDGGNVEGNQWIEQAAVQGDVMVAVGAAWDFAAEQARPTVWTSTACGSLDGALSTEEGSYCWAWFQPDGPAYATAVGASSTGFVVGGHTVGDPERGLVWLSGDGATWLEGEGTETLVNIQPRAISVLDDGVLMGGLFSGDGVPLWIGSGPGD